MIEPWVWGSMGRMLAVPAGVAPLSRVTANACQRGGFSRSAPPIVGWLPAAVTEPMKSLPVESASISIPGKSEKAAP